MASATLKYRLGWTQPIVISPHDPNVIYTTAERVFKTTDEGKTWTAISPDLTRNDKSKQVPSGGPLTKDNTSVEYYDTVFTHRGIARAERFAVGGHRRWADSRLARWRQELGERHAEGNSRVEPGQSD